MTFSGKARWTSDVDGGAVHPHESKPIMTVPMIILAVFAVGLGGVLSINDVFTTWLTPAIGSVDHAEPVLSAIWIQIITLVLVLIAAAFAWVKFGKEAVPKAAPYGNAFSRAARNDFYQDEINEVIAVAPTTAAVEGVTAVDRYGIDGGINGLGRLSVWTGKVIAWTETGYLRSYAGYMLGGVVVIVAIVLGFRL